MFSKTYLKEPAGTNQESERLRNRLAAEASSHWKQGETHRQFMRIMARERGVVFQQGVSGPYVGEFFERAPMRDVLVRPMARDAIERLAFSRRPVG